MSEITSETTNALPTIREAGNEAENKVRRFWVGTYTGPNSKGIYLFDFDTTTGQITPQGLAGEVASPSFLAFHPSRRFLYAVSEVGNFEGRETGAIAAFAVDAATSKLTLLNQQASEGTSPCHLVVDRAGKYVLTANYSSGSVASLPIHADGRLGKAVSVQQQAGKGLNAGRQEGPHAHSIYFDSSMRRALSADLGTDKVYLYDFDDTSGKLTPHTPPAGDVPPGSGPRHLAFAANHRYVYALCELNATVVVFDYDAASGRLTPKQTLVTLPPYFKGQNTAAEVQVSPDGKFLYASNRGADSIAALGIDARNGTLTLLGNTPTEGKNPRFFCLDPTGGWVLAVNQDGNNIVVLKRDPQSGLLSPTGQSASLSAPVCIVF